MNFEKRDIDVTFDPPLTNCPICESPFIEFWKNKFVNSTKYTIYRCSNCTAGFLNPRPSDETLESIYRFSGHGLSQEVSYDEIREREKEYPNSSIDAARMISYCSQLLSSYVPISNKRKSALIDIGSGFGFFSLYGARLGFDIISVNPGIYENSIYKEMFVRNKLKPNLYEGEFDDFTFEKDFFAVAIASQIIEHIKKPREMVKKIEEILMPGGVLAVAVPNFNSLFVKGLGTKDRSCLWVPEHCNYFTQRSLEMLTGRTGFNLTKLNHIC